MKVGVRWIFGSLAVSLLVGCSDRSAPGNEAQASREGTIPEAVREELVQLGAEDQEIRQNLSPERMEDTAFVNRMLHGDSIRAVRLRMIVEEYGWPDSVQAGPEAAGAAFLLLQHSPEHEFQKEMLPVIEEHAKRGLVPAQQAALLIDRVLMHEDLPQRYGTQFKMVDGQLVLHPVENEDGLEGRRRAMGLPSMEEYMRLVEDMYDAPIARQP
jgi:hypothetical protein